MKKITFVLVIFLCFAAAEIVAQQNLTENNSDEREKTENIQPFKKHGNTDLERRGFDENEIDLRFYTGNVDPNEALRQEEPNVQNADTRFIRRDTPDIDLSDFPVFIDTGNLAYDLEVYDKAKKLWIAQNPEKYEALQK